MFQDLLLAAGTTLVLGASDDETKGGRYAHFNGMFFMVVFVAAVFLVGKVTGALGAPSLVGRSGDACIADARIEVERPAYPRVTDARIEVERNSACDPPVLCSLSKV